MDLVVGRPFALGMARIQRVSEQGFYKSQETAPNRCQRVSEVRDKKLAETQAVFLCASFYVPTRTDNTDYLTHVD